VRSGVTELHDLSFCEEHPKAKRCDDRQYDNRNGHCAIVSRIHLTTNHHFFFFRLTARRFISADGHQQVRATVWDG
jgi:hypothetical protein